MMTYRSDEAHTARRLRALNTWHPTTTVAPTAVVRAGRRRRAAQISALAVAATLVVAAVVVSTTALGSQPASVPAASDTDDVGPGDERIDVVVNAGDSAAMIATTLYEAGVVASADAFVEVCVANLVQCQSIEPGTYSLTTQMSAADALAALVDPANRRPVSDARQTMAAAAPDPAGALDESSWADAPYWYTKSTHHYAGKMLDFSNEQWFDRGNTVWTVADNPNMGTVDTGGYELDGGFFLGGFWDASPPAEWWATLSALPTAPAALEARLRTEALGADDVFGNPQPGMRNDKALQDAEIWAQIYQIWPGSPASYELRMALMQVAQGLSGTTVTPDVTDQQGRVGIAISGRVTYLRGGAGGGVPGEIETGGGTGPMVTLIVDPLDGTVLESQIQCTGATVYYATFVAMGPAHTR